MPANVRKRRARHERFGLAYACVEGSATSGSSAPDSTRVAGARATWTGRMSDVMLPPFVTIGPVVYRVTIDPDEWLKKEHEQEKKGNFGYTDHRLGTIYLNPDMPPTMLRLTLTHECLHAMTASAMGAPEWTQLGKDPEETVVRRFESPTLDLIRDNPDLIAYLTEGA